MTDVTDGSPYDRGSADAYYGRPNRPHYYAGKTRVEVEDMSADQIADYRRGFREEQGRKRY